MNKTLFEMMGLNVSSHGTFLGRISCEHCIVEEVTNNMFVPHEKSCKCIIYFNVNEEFTSPINFIDLPEGCVIIYDEY